VDYSKLENAQLMLMIAAQETAALGELYDRFGRLVYSMAYNVLGDGALAEEVTQDVFLRVWEKAETYQSGQGRVAAWLTSMARNRSIDIYRSRKVRPEGNLVGFPVEEALDLPDEMNVEASVETRDRRVRLHHALAQLPEPQRQALSYAFFRGYSHGEIAEALHQPLGTIKTRIRLAMQKLRELIGEELELPD
jgi:RNA polymerase sigma-70 factor, ECF subfamily